MRLMLAALAALWIGPAEAQMMTGELLRFCNPADKVAYTLAGMYISGLVEGEAAAMKEGDPNAFCVPAGSSNAQIRELVCTVFKATSALPELPAAYQVLAIMHASYPCKTRTNP